MNKKTALNILGVIILGALGSGLWDLMKPLLAMIAAALANFSTLGIESLRDDLYAMAGKSVGRPVGVATAVLTLAVWMTFLFSIVLRVLSKSSDAMVAKHAKQFMFLGIAWGIFLMAQLVRGNYALQLANYYEKLEVIASPHLTELEIKQFRAAFSQVQTRSQFQTITNTLSSKILQAGGTPPSPP
jgi:hypothetical protein